jgi:hypothetical protein
MSHFDWDEMIQFSDEVARQLDLDPQGQDDLRESMRQAQRGEGRVLRTKEDGGRFLIAQHRGYILALEDVIKDIDQLRAVTHDEEKNIFLYKIQNKVLNSWVSARESLDRLNKIEETT